MPPSVTAESGFDAVTHAMPTIATGGFANYDESFAWFKSPALEWAATLFMAMGALPLVIYVRMTLGQWREAVADYDRVLKTQPSYAEAWCNRGVALQRLGDFGSALTSFERALQLRETYAEAHCNRGACLRELKRGGQIYYVHNDVATIENARAKLQSILPESRIVIAHGQMRPTVLEDVMTSFADRPVRSDVVSRPSTT